MPPSICSLSALCFVKKTPFYLKFKTTVQVLISTLSNTEVKGNSHQNQWLVKNIRKSVMQRNMEGLLRLTPIFACITQHQFVHLYNKKGSYEKSYVHKAFGGWNKYNHLSDNNLRSQKGLHFFCFPLLKSKMRLSDQCVVKDI